MNSNKMALKYLKDLKKLLPNLSLIEAINIALPALEKQIPVKVAHITRFYDKEVEKWAHVGRCPKCWHSCAEGEYCPKCGQKLDWGEEE